MTYQATSCILFHGPGAEDEGQVQARAYGHLLAFTGSGLKKDGARELVELLAHRPVGDRKSAVLVGPVDDVSTSTSDVLLKSIEEFHPEGTRPFLWAWDLGGVSDTLKSRCLLRFSPGTDVRIDSYGPQAKGLLDAYLAGDWPTLIEGVKDQEDLDLLLRAVVDRIGVNKLDLKLLTLWSELRGLFGASPLTVARVLSAFMKAHSQTGGSL